MAGTLQGKVSLWDVAKQAVRVECEKHETSGVTRMLWAPGHNLICGTLDGNVRGYDDRSGQQKVSFFLFCFTKHLLMYYFCCFSLYFKDTWEKFIMSFDKKKTLLLTVSDDTAKLITSFLL